MNNHMLFRLEGERYGIDINSVANSVYLQSEVEGLSSLPSIRTTSGTNIGMNGGWTSAMFYDARLITIQGVIADPDVSVVEQRRRELTLVLSQKKLKLKFTTEGGHDYVVDVVVTGMTMPIAQVLQASYFKIDLRADDPIIYGDVDGEYLTAVVNVSNPATSGFPINFNLPLTMGDPMSRPVVENAGNATVYGEIELHGILHEPTIANATTNEYLELDISLGASDVVKIDTKTRIITLNGNNIYRHVTEGSSWITLAPGRNEFVLLKNDSNDDGYAVIRYRNGYMGV